MSTGAAAMPIEAPGGERLRQLRAMLRWRARGLGRQVDPHLAEAGRLLAILLHTSYQKTTLQDEPPGVSGLHFSPAWARRAAAFGLPPPSGMQRNACLVEAVFAYPVPAGLELVVLVAPDLRPEELRHVDVRIELATAILRKKGLAPTVTRLDAVAFCATAPAARTFLFGALLAGQPTPPTWEALLHAWSRPAAADEVAWIFGHAPTSLSALATGLLTARGVPPLLAAVEWATARGLGARALAATDVAALAWASLESEVAPELEAALRLVHPPPGRLASRAAGQPRPAPLRPDLAELLRVGGRLSLAFLRAVRRSPALRASPRWREVIAAGVPRALLDCVGAGMKASGTPRELRVRLDPVPGPRGFEVPLGNGVLARGATPLQARIRALALATEAGGEAQLAGLESPWRALATRVGRPRSRPALLLVVGEAVGNEPPLDPLNRGARRQLGFTSALVVRLAPGRRPAARIVAADQAVESFVQAAHAGFEVDVLPSSPGATSVAQRLNQVVKLLGARPQGRAASPAGESPPSVAVEVGGEVYLSSPGRLRRYPLDRFLARPRTFFADPGAPDLSLAPGELPAPRSHATGPILVRVSLARPGRAWLFYSDGLGRFREEVALEEVEEHLRDARSALQEVQPGVAFIIRSDAEMDAACRRAGPAAAARRLDVQVRGEFPSRLQVRIGAPRPSPEDEGDGWFGGSSPDGWSAAALAAMAHWVPGQEGFLACRSALVTAPPGCSQELAVVHARSVAIRRLNAHIRRLLGPYRTLEESRRVV